MTLDLGIEQSLLSEVVSPGKRKMVLVNWRRQQPHVLKQQQNKPQLEKTKGGKVKPCLIDHRFNILPFPTVKFRLREKVNIRKKPF